MDEKLISEIREQLNSAVKLVSDIDESIRVDAFQFVLKRFLGNGGNGKTSTKPNEIQKEPESFYSKLSQASNVPEEILETLIGVNEEGNKPILRFKPSSFSSKEQQIQATLVYMATKHVCFGDRTADSKELLNTMKELGIESLANYAPYLKALPSYFIISGKHIKEYKITQPGIDKGMALIKEKAKENKLQ